MNRIICVFILVFAFTANAQETRRQGSYGDASAGSGAESNYEYEVACAQAITGPANRGVEIVGNGFMGFTANRNGSDGSYLFSNEGARFFAFEDMQQTGDPEFYPEYMFYFDHPEFRGDEATLVKSKEAEPTVSQYEVDRQDIAYGGFPQLEGEVVNDHITQNAIISSIEEALRSFDDQLSSIRRQLRRTREKAAGGRPTTFSVEELEQVERTFPGDVQRALCACQSLHQLAELIEQIATSTEGISYPLSCP